MHASPRRLLRRAPLALVALALAAGTPLLAQDDDPASAEGDQPWLVLPDDPLGRLWASVGPETRPYVPELTAGADPWSDWAKALKAGEGDARRDAALRLARIAQDDGRIEDAYAWIVGLGADEPEALAGAVPRLFPGIAPDVELASGGRPPALPNGAVLTPQLPPRSSAAQRGSVEVREATARRLTIGDATFDMRLKVDGSGVVCDFTHVAGGRGVFLVQLPAPEGFRLRSAYVDWEIQELPEGEDAEVYDWSTTTLPVRLDPDPEVDATEMTLFARVERRTTAFPTPPNAAGPLPKSVADSGLLMVLPDDERPADWEPVRGGWSAALGVEVRLVDADRFRELSTTGGPPLATAIRLDRAPDPQAVRRLVTSAIEARIRDRQGL